MDITALAVAATQVLAPFLPYLLSIGKSIGGKVEEVVSDRASEALWERAKQLWERLSERFTGDDEVTGAASLVAAAPENEGRAQILAEILAQRLKGDPALAAELQALLGGPERVQRVAAGDDAEIRRIRQKMAKPGIQEVTGGARAKISDVDQVMG